MRPRTIGMVILFLGICEMIATASSVFSVFTGRTAPISLFHLPALRFNPAAMMPASLGGIPLPGSGSQTAVDLYPADAINFMANITAHLFLAGFFVNLGYKFASLGIQLVAADKTKEMPASPSSTLPVALRPNPPPILTN